MPVVRGPGKMPLTGPCISPCLRMISAQHPAAANYAATTTTWILLLYMTSTITAIGDHIGISQGQNVTEETTWVPDTGQVGPSDADTLQPVESFQDPASTSKPLYLPEHDHLHPISSGSELHPTVEGINRTLNELDEHDSNTSAEVESETITPLLEDNISPVSPSGYPSDNSVPSLSDVNKTVVSPEVGQKSKAIYKGGNSLHPIEGDYFPVNIMRNKQPVRIDPSKGDHRFHPAEGEYRSWSKPTEAQKSHPATGETHTTEEQSHSGSPLSKTEPNSTRSEHSHLTEGDNSDPKTSEESVQSATGHHHRLSHAEPSQSAHSADHSAPSHTPSTAHTYHNLTSEQTMLNTSIDTASNHSQMEVDDTSNQVSDAHISSDVSLLLPTSSEMNQTSTQMDEQNINHILPADNPSNDAEAGSDVASNNATDDVSSDGEMGSKPAPISTNSSVPPPSHDSYDISDSTAHDLGNSNRTFIVSVSNNATVDDYDYEYSDYFDDANYTYDNDEDADNADVDEDNEDDDDYDYYEYDEDYDYEENATYFYDSRERNRTPKGKKISQYDYEDKNSSDIEDYDYYISEQDSDEWDDGQQNSSDGTSRGARNDTSFYDYDIIDDGEYDEYGDDDDDVRKHSGGAQWIIPRPGASTKLEGELFYGPDGDAVQIGPLEEMKLSKGQPVEVHPSYLDHNSHDISLSILVFYSWIGVVTIILIGAFIAIKHRHRIATYVWESKSGYRKETVFATEEGRNLLTHQHV